MRITLHLTTIVHYCHYLIFENFAGHPSESLGERIAYYFLYMLYIIINATYSAILVSQITVYIPELFFRNLGEFAGASSHKIITFNDSLHYDAAQVL